MINRAYNICSSYLIFNDEIKKLKHYFTNNRYPGHIFDSILRNFLNTKFAPSDKPISVPKLIKYVKLPYYGKHTFKIRNELQQVLKNNFMYINFRLIFTNPFKIQSFFNHKDKIPEKIRSKVVYNYNCSRCNSRYIGSTERLYFSRIQEHLGNSIHTFRPISTPSYSAIREHAHQKDHPMDTTQFSIIDSATDLLTLHIKESIHIQDHNPSLNINTTCKTLYTL